MFSRISTSLSDIFTIDLRSLALTRIFVAFIVLCDLVSRLPSIRTFIGEGSVFPPSLLESTWTSFWAWSWHLVGGASLWIMLPLFAIHILAALALLLGWRTRVASVVTWVLLVSLHNANPFILQGGDFWLRAILFTGMFMPWGAVFSLDARRSSISSTSLLSGWSVAYVLQVGLFYFFAALFKTGAAWTTEGTAVYYALSIDQYATWFAHLMLGFPYLTQLTYGILFVQHVTLFLMLFPWRNAQFRTFAVALTIFWHAALAACLHLGMFSWISMAAVVALVPSALWDTILSYLKRTRESTYARIRAYVPISSGRPLSQSAFVSLLGLFYLLYIFFWQIGDFIPSLTLTPTMRIPAQVLRIDQRWNLFAPYPFRNDGWYVMRGTLEGGGEVNVFNDLPLTDEKPANVFKHYPNMRWRKLTYEARRPGSEWLMPRIAEERCIAWNRTHEEKVTSVDITYMVELTPPPGQPVRVRPAHIGIYACR